LDSSLPPAELARRDSTLFREVKRLYSIAPVARKGGEKTRTQGGRGPARPVPRGTSASGRTPFGTVLNVELIGRVARLVTCDRMRPVAVGALWTPTGRRVQRVRSNAEARPVTTMAPSDTHCCCLSYSALTGASGHHVFTASSGNG
jgi:hypothetical protein